MKSKNQSSESEQPESGSGVSTNGTDDNVDGEEAEEGLGCDGEGLGQTDLDAEGEDDVELGEGTSEQREGEEAERRPVSSSTSYSTSPPMQVTAGFATPPPAPLEKSPSTNLATPPSAHSSSPLSAHLATLPFVHLAMLPLPAHLATPLSTHFATLPSVRLATLPSSVLLATPPPPAHLAIHAQDATDANDLGVHAIQGFQPLETSLMDLLGGDSASGTGFDTWGDPFTIPQAPLPGVQPTVLNAAFGLTEFSNMLYFGFNAVGSVGPEGFNSSYIPFFPNNVNSVGVPGDADTLPFQSSSALDPVNPLQAWYSTPLSSMSPLPYSPPLGFTTGIPLGTGDRPVPVPVMGLYPHRGYTRGV